MARVGSIPGYAPLFKAAFPADPEPMSRKNMAFAIGAFERTLVTPARFDEYLGGNVDALSAGVQKRRSRVKAATLSPAVSAVMVLLNLELGYAPEMMRGALENAKGKALLDEGRRALGAHLLKELIK